MRAMARSASVADVDHFRELELVRLDRLWRTLWPPAVGPPPDCDAIDRLILISAHRVRLLGLNREPSVDFEAEICKAAIVAGEDPDEAVREFDGVSRLRGPTRSRRATARERLTQRPWEFQGASSAFRRALERLAARRGSSCGRINLSVLATQQSPASHCTRGLRRLKGL